MTRQHNGRRVLVLENPRSGGGGDVRELTDLLARQGADLTLRVLDPGRPCSEAVRDLGDFDALVVAGGDGTVSSVTYAARGSGVPILIYPAGTANLIAQNLQLPSAPGALAEVLWRGHSVTADLGELRAGGETYGFTLIAGAGLDAEMIRQSEPLKPTMGAVAYLVSVLKQLSPTRARIRLDLDGRQVETEAISVLIANFGMINFRLPVAGGIDPADGKLSVLVIKGHSALSLLPSLLNSLRLKLGLGGPAPRRNVDIYTCERVRVEASAALPIQYDGELIEAGLPMEARVLPGAARFLTDKTLEELST